MPNWCTNKLTITAKTVEELIVFIDENSSTEDGVLEPLKFNQSVPSSLDDDWHASNVLKWGTKWEAITEKNKWEKTGDTKYALNFDTAWAPPFNWMLTTSRIYPNIVFGITYYGEGVDFYGTTIMIDGVTEELDLTEELNGLSELYKKTIEDELDKDSTEKDAVRAADKAAKESDYNVIYDFLQEKKFFENELDYIVGNRAYEKKLNESTEPIAKPETETEIIY